MSGPRLERCAPDALVTVFPLEGRGLVGWGRMGGSYSSDLVPGDWVAHPRETERIDAGYRPTPVNPEGMVVAVLSRQQEEAEDGKCVLVLWHG